MIVLSRRQQQRKRRQKQFDPLKVSGYDNRPRRHGLMWRLLHNQWIVFGGIAIIALGTILGTVLSSVTGGSSGSSSVLDFETVTPGPSVTAAPDASATGTPASSATPAPQRRFTAAPTPMTSPDKHYFATIRTDKGSIRIQLFPKEAPEAVNNFVFLAQQGYYDGLTFHRVIPGFVAQAGDAGPGSPGYAIPPDNSSLKHDPGAVAFARSNATGQLTAQFYISLQPQSGQDGKDTVFGKVVSGMDVLDRLTPRNPDRTPNSAPGDKILDVKIEEQAVS